MPPPATTTDAATADPETELARLHPSWIRYGPFTLSGFVAIGVVGGTLARQPRNIGEALATARALRSAGWNFSVGLGQINVTNFERLGLSRRAFGRRPPMGLRARPRAATLGAATSAKASP